MRQVRHQRKATQIRMFFWFAVCQQGWACSNIVCSVTRRQSCGKIRNGRALWKVHLPAAWKSRRLPADPRLCTIKGKQIPTVSFKPKPSIENTKCQNMGAYTVNWLYRTCPIRNYEEFAAKIPRGRRSSECLLFRLTPVDSGKDAQKSCRGRVTKTHHEIDL